MQIDATEKEPTEIDEASGHCALVTTREFVWSQRDSLEIKAQTSQNPLIWTQLVGDQRCIVYHVTTEQEASKECVNEVHGLAERNKCANKAGNNYNGAS